MSGFTPEQEDRIRELIRKELASREVVIRLTATMPEAGVLDRMREELETVKAEIVSNCAAHEKRLAARAVRAVRSAILKRAGQEPVR